VSVGCQDEVVTERLDGSPSTIIDGAEDTQRTARATIPMNLHLNLIGSAGGASQFGDLWFAD
jgi:hypothetical protein